jgi:hypothetical protein
LRSGVRRSGRQCLLPEGVRSDVRRSGLRTQGLRTVLEALRSGMRRSGELLHEQLCSWLRRSGQLLHANRLLQQQLLRNRSVDLQVDDRLLCQGSSQGDS